MSALPPVWVVIPARTAARRLPDKPLRDLGGLPLVEHVRRRASAARSAARVLIATDDPRVAELVRGHGGEAILTGPAPSGTHRVALAVGDRPPCGIINVQGDQPLLDPDHVDVVAAMLGAGAVIATLSAPWPTGADPASPALVKVGAGPTFTRRVLPGARLHVGIYGFAPSALAAAAAAPPSARSIAEDLEQLAWLDAGLPITVGPVDGSAPGVDTPAQLEALRRRFQAGELRVPALVERAPTPWTVPQRPGAR